MSASNICIICCRSSQHAVILNAPIPCSFDDESKNCRYLDCLHYCSKMDFEKWKMKLICDVCANDLEKTYYFLQQVKVAHQRLLAEHEFKEVAPEQAPRMCPADIVIKEEEQILPIDDEPSWDDEFTNEENSFVDNTYMASEGTGGSKQVPISETIRVRLESSTSIVVDAVKEIKLHKKSIRSVAKSKHIASSTLTRYIRQIDEANIVVTSGSNKKLIDFLTRKQVQANASNMKPIFDAEQEEEFLKEIVQASELNNGLSIVEVNCHAYRFAIANDIVYPPSWNINLRAGKDWYYSFIRRQRKLLLRIPKDVNQNRASSMNKDNADLHGMLTTYDKPSTSEYLRAALGETDCLTSTSNGGCTQLISPEVHSDAKGQMLKDGKVPARRKKKPPSSRHKMLYFLKPKCSETNFQYSKIESD